MVGVHDGGDDDAYAYAGVSDGYKQKLTWQRLVLNPSHLITFNVPFLPAQLYLELLAFTIILPIFFAIHLVPSINAAFKLFDSVLIPILVHALNVPYLIMKI